MSENELSKIIVNTAFQIRTKLGPGLLESVYEEIMNYKLISQGHKVERQKAIPVIWNELKMRLILDLTLLLKVIIELKSLETLALVHPKQLLTYLKLTNCKLGLLINFQRTFNKKWNNQNCK